METIDSEVDRRPLNAQPFHVIEPFFEVMVINLTDSESQKPRGMVL